MTRLRIAENTVQDLEDMISRNGATPYVLFSGGKDSLTTLNLVNIACNATGRKPVAIHADTTVGIPDNLEYVKETCSHLRIRLVTVKPKVDYFDLAKKKGLPRFGARWCCGELKIKPLASYLRNQAGEKMVFDGIRSQESKIREEMPKSSWHKYFLCDVYHPIKDWTNEDVQSYLVDRGLSPNPLYAKGFRRASECWCGVFKGVAEFRILRDTYPEFFQRLMELEASMRNGGSYLFTHGKKVYLKDLWNERE